MKGGHVEESQKGNWLEQSRRAMLCLKENARKDGGYLPLCAYAQVGLIGVMTGRALSWRD